MLKRGIGTRRNDRCVCGSGKKFKYCCSPSASRQPGSPQKRTHYIDTGEVPVRYVITDEKGTSFFSTKDNAIIVFKSRADAIAVATLDDFADSGTGEINVAGVGETKWKHLREKLPFLEVDKAEDAIALVKERMEYVRAWLEAEAQRAENATAQTTTPPEAPENG